MNITDVDDKIILHARRNYLFDQYSKKAESSDPKIVISDISRAFDMISNKLNDTRTNLREELKTTPKNQFDEKMKILQGEEVKISNFEKQRENFEQSVKLDSPISSLLLSGRDVLSDLLDFERGSEIDDLSIFKKHSEKFEAEFLEDLKALNIRDVDCLTRVTEFIPQIVDYVSKIIENGFAYESNGSVYFDIKAFLDSGANYPKLRPNQLGNEALLFEGEGSIKVEGSEKKNSIDFALWKKSKGGEP